LLVSAGGLALLAAASGLWSTALGAALIGMGYGPITPASSHLLARATPPHRVALVFSIKQTGVPLGGVVAGAFVPALLLTGGIVAALLAVAAANLVCALVAQPLRAFLDSDREPGRIGHRLERRVSGRSRAACAAGAGQRRHRWSAGRHLPRRGSGAPAFWRPVRCVRQLSRRVPGPGASDGAVRLGPAAPRPCGRWGCITFKSEVITVSLK
jgi:MFS family permease